MARRRAVLLEEDREPELPERLRDACVENWVSPTDIPPHLSPTVNGKPPTAEDVTDALEIVAWRLQRTALREWAETTGARPSSTSPTFRNRPAFVARVASAIQQRNS